MSDSEDDNAKTLKRGRKRKVHPEAIKSDGKVDMDLNEKIRNKRTNELSKMTTIISAINKYCKSENLSARLMIIPNDTNKIDKPRFYMNCPIEVFERRVYEMQDSFTILDSGNIYSEILNQKERSIKNQYLPPNGEISGHKTLSLPFHLSELGLQSTKKKKKNEE